MKIIELNPIKQEPRLKSVGTKYIFKIEEGKYGVFFMDSDAEKMFPMPVYKKYKTIKECAYDFRGDRYQFEKEVGVGEPIKYITLEEFLIKWVEGELAEKN